MNDRDPYLYPDVDVLVNKMGIKDQKRLDELEQDVVPLRIMMLRKKVQGYQMGRFERKRQNTKSRLNYSRTMADTLF